MFALILSLLFILSFSGCTYARRAVAKLTPVASRNTTALAEEARANNTAARDALAAAPTNAPVALAEKLVARNEQILGTPVKRIDVPALLAQDAAAWHALSNRFNAQQNLLGEREKLRVQLDAANARLVEMGKKYEEEKNRSFVKRFWFWSTATFGLLGGIAFMVFCPAAALAIIPRVVGFLVAKLPKLASLFGVVSGKAFDAVVSGFGKIRADMKATPDRTLTAQETWDLMKARMDETTRAAGSNFKPLIDERRAALGTT